jgi:hypothetical protein
MMLYGLQSQSGCYEEERNLLSLLEIESVLISASWVQTEELLDREVAAPV